MSLISAIGRNDPALAREEANHMIARGERLSEQEFFSTYSDIVRRGNPALVGPLVSVLEPTGYKCLVREALKDRNADRLAVILTEFKAQVLDKEPEQAAAIMRELLPEMVRYPGDLPEKLADFMVEHQIAPAENTLWNGIRTALRNRPQYPYPTEEWVPAHIPAGKDGLIYKMAALSLEHGVSLLPSQESNVADLYLLTDVMKNLSRETARIVTTAYFQQERMLVEEPEQYATNHIDVVKNVLVAKSFIREALNPERDSKTLLDDRTGRFKVKFYPAMLKLLPDNIPLEKREAVAHWCLENLEKDNELKGASPWSWDKLRVEDAAALVVRDELGSKEFASGVTNAVLGSSDHGPMSLILSYLNSDLRATAVPMQTSAIGKQPAVSSWK